MERFNVSYEKTYKKIDPKTPFLRLRMEDFLREVPKLYKEKSDTRLKICLIRYGARGDVLLLSPIVKAIKEKYPQVNLTVSTDYPEMLCNNPHVDNLISIKTDYSKYDRVYCLAYEFEPNVHIVQAYANQIGIEVEDYKPELYLIPDEMKEANMIINKLNLKKFFILHVECDWQTRRWYGWNELIDAIQNDETLKEYNIIEVGKGEQKFTPYNVPMIKHNNIRIIAALIQYSSGLICIDSVIMHLGVALNKPVFSIFGITDPNKRLPEKWLPIATQHDGKTAGIHHNSIIPAETEPSCVQDCIQDMKNLEPIAIFLKMKNFFFESFNKFFNNNSIM